MRRLAVLAALLLLALPAVAAPPPVRLAAHRALYRLTLADGRGQVIGAAGVMGYQVVDACHSWNVRQRLELTVTNTDGDTTHMVSEYVTSEAKNGPGGPGVADYARPEVKQVALPAGTLFPMGHTAALIRAAEAGRTFFTLPVFDGTDDAGAELSSIVALGHRGPTPSHWPALAALPSVDVHIAFFGSDTEKMLPDYEVGMRYWTNGVADDLRMDFGDFVMVGKLIGFQLLPSHC